MIVTFHSIDNENEKVFFKTKGEQKENSIFFKDESMPNTTIELKIEASSVELIRSGDYNTNMLFQKNKKTKAYYRNNLGLEFDFYVETKVLDIKKNKISIEYNMFLFEEEISTHKIWILLH